MGSLDLQWLTADGVKLAAQDWRPEGSAVAVVGLVHGLGEHQGRYGHVIAALNRAGFAVLGFDLRGHGRSEGPRGYVPAYDALLDDIDLLLAQAAQRYPSLPRFLYGHSLGGNLVLIHTLRRRPTLAGVVATSPILRTAFKPPAWKLVLGRAMCRLWPRLSMSNEIDPDGLSHDAQVARAYVDDPLVHARVSPRLGIGLIEAGLWLLDHAAEFRLPLLLVHGGADPITSAQATREFAQRVPGDCTCKIWEGLYHETHNEPQKAEVIAFTIEWLKAHIP